MTIDTAAITQAVTDFINQALGYLPLGLAIIGIPSAILIGLGFGEKIINMVKKALTSGGR